MKASRHRRSILLAVLIGLHLGAAAAADRRPVPPREARERVEERLRTRFRIDSVSTTGEARRLAGRLFQLAKDAREDDERYVLSRKAAEFAAKAGEVEQALEATAAIARVFEVDELADRLAILELAAKSAADVPSRHAVLDALASLAADAVAKDAYETARAAADEAERVARKLRDRCLVSAAKERTRRIRAIEREYRSSEVEKALATLADRPDDPAANLVLGRFRALVKGDWKAGLACLAKVGLPWGATVDLELTGPDEPSEMVRIADGWLRVSEAETGLFATRFRERAAYWYERALPLLSGLEKVETAAKLKELPFDADLCFLKDAVLLLSFDRSTYFRRRSETWVRDLSGRGNHGKVEGVRGVKGQAGEAVDFFDAACIVDCGKVDDFNPTQSMTVAAWVSYRSSRPGGYIVSRDDWSGGEHGFVLRVRSGGALDLTLGAGGWKDALSTERLQKDRWHHVAGVYNGREIVVYIDGDESGRSRIRERVARSRYNLRVGRGHYDAKRRFDGLIDEVALFDRALGAEEVRLLYRYGLRGRSFE